MHRFSTSRFPLFLISRCFNVQYNAEEYILNKEDGHRHFQARSAIHTSTSEGEKNRMNENCKYLSQSISNCVAGSKCTLIAF